MAVVLVSLQTVDINMFMCCHLCGIILLLTLSCLWLVGTYLHWPLTPVDTIPVVFGDFTLD